MNRPALQPAPEVKVYINVGAGLDIPNGNYLTGIHGESILNGGVGMFNGYTGIGNNFKSTVMWFMKLTSSARMGSDYIGNYDTEINLEKSRIIYMASRIPEFRGRDIDDVENPILLINDKRQYYANEWFDAFRTYCKDRRKDAKKLTIQTPFYDRRNNCAFEIIQPVMQSVDSLTEFQTEDVGDMMDDNELGDSSRNTLFMKQGKSKSEFIMELPALAHGASCYTFITAQLGKMIAMDPRAAPEKKLQHLKNGDKMKGVTDKFTFLTSDLYHMYNAAPLLSKSTKAPEYPHRGHEYEGDTDLCSVMIRNLRSKTGQSGRVLELIVSQSEGVLPGLTEFHSLRENDWFGINGDIKNCSLVLYPEQKLTRTTVRDLIESDKKLSRALNITSELGQMHLFWPIHQFDSQYKKQGFVCSAQELYDDIKKAGYDWDMILTHTRGWWCPIGMFEDLLFLSTMDLLKMRAGLYHPYWLEEDKKTIKKEYADKLPKAA